MDGGVLWRSGCDVCMTERPCAVARGKDTNTPGESLLSPTAIIAGAGVKRGSGKTQVKWGFLAN